MREEKYIVVNATALDKSGALSILMQFIDNIPINEYRWLIFVSIDIKTFSLKYTNVRLVSVSGVKPMFKRLWWDVFGLNRWLKHNNVKPSALISLQNTGFRTRYKGIPKFIYYHQPIPFYPYRWNPFNGKERPLWFYKYIYPLLVKMFLTKDTYVFVQLDYIKTGFIKKFHHTENRIDVFSPSVNSPNFSRLNLPINTLNLFYPATDFFYKNHRVLKEAINITKKDVNLYTTLPIEKSLEKIICLGVIPYEKVCAMYNSCDAMLFPSYIETFGLPLIEAAMTGLPIIVSDLPYSREVLSGYDGATFIRYNDPDAWANAIDSLKKGIRYNPIDISRRKGWTELFQSIMSKL